MPAICWLAVVVWTQAAGARPPAATPYRPGTATIRGTIVDARTSVPIGDARVTLAPIQAAADDNGSNATASDRLRWLNTGADGRFEFAELPSGAYVLTVSTIGYIFVRRTVDVSATAAVVIVVPLAEGTGTYQETVNVSGSRAAPTLGVGSQLELGSAGLQELRGVAADDPVRAMQALPGVTTGDDFNAEFSVRGSAFRHVGLVVDGTPTPVLMHTVRGEEDTGSIAMINTDVLSGASLLTGPQPLRHGYWLGPTLEFDVRDGSRDRYGVRAAVSGTSASAVLEGPFGPTKRGSWLVSVRKSYLDWLIRKVEPEVDSTIGFVDGIAKVTFDLTTRQQAQLLILGGRSTYQEQQAARSNGLLHATASSGLLSAAWRYARSPWVLVTRASFVGSDFRNIGVVAQELGRGYTQSVTIRADATAALGRGWTLETGGRHEQYRLNHVLREYGPAGGGRVRIRDERDVTARTRLLGGWAQVSHRSDAAGLVLGVNAVSRTLADRGAVLPWVLAERVAGRVTFRGSAGGSAQFPDPVFLDEPLSIRPERAWSFDAGADYRLTDATHLQITAFHRTESDVVRNIGEARLANQGQTRFPESTFPVFRQSLEGTTRGVDLILRHWSSAGVNGWMGYTWAHTRHHDTTTGEEFDGDFDQRHTLNAFVQVRLSYRMMAGAKLRVGSNFPIAGYFEARGNDTLWLSSMRNDVRLPTYARLDLRGSRTFTMGRGRLTLFVEIMNALGRRNVGQADGTIRPNLEAVGYVEKLIPFVPSAGVLIEF